MNDSEFASLEIDFRSAVATFKEACDTFGVDAGDRIANAIADAGFSHVEIEE